MSEQKRITHKDVTIGGKEYRIKRMDARQASYIAFQLKTFLPQGKDAGEMIGAAQFGMSRKEFYSLQNDCLSACYHLVPAGEIPVIDGNAIFQNKDLEDDARTVVLLTVQALALNVTDFFDENFLMEFMATIQSIFPSFVKM